MKELKQFLLDRPMEHDSPAPLFNLARECLMSAKVIRPGAVTLAKMVRMTRAGATELAPSAQILGGWSSSRARSSTRARSSLQAPRTGRHDAGTGTGAMELPGPMSAQPFWKGRFSNRWAKKA
jgi:hypothetical protein